MTIKKIPAKKISMMVMMIRIPSSPILRQAARNGGD